MPRTIDLDAPILTIGVSLDQAIKQTADRVPAIPLAVSSAYHPRAFNVDINVLGGGGPPKSIDATFVLTGNMWNDVGKFSYRLLLLSQLRGVALDRQ